jgi:hypothetical protein
LTADWRRQYLTGGLVRQCLYNRLLWREQRLTDVEVLGGHAG